MKRTINKPVSRIVMIDPAFPSTSVVREATRVLRQGGRVAFPTETVYGLGARALDPEAVARIFTAKGRPANHPLIAHVLGVSDASALAARWSSLADELASRFWPGPLTLVVERAVGIPSVISGGASTIALRAPAHPVARALIAALGEPIAAPSANRYQSISPTQASHVASSLGSNVDMILDGGRSLCGIESTVVDLTGERPRILRHGAIPIGSIRNVVDVEIATGPVASNSSRVSPGMDARHYAPKTKLVLVDRRDLIADMCLAEGGSVGVMLCGVADRSFEASRVVELPADPELYARELFATLHDLDARGLKAVIVEAPPNDESWLAVRDRLVRAQA